MKRSPKSGPTKGKDAAASYYASADHRLTAEHPWERITAGNRKINGRLLYAKRPAAA